MESHWQEDHYVNDMYGDEEDVPFDCEETEAPSDCKYPHVTVQLVGEDGNAFAVLGRVSGAMRRAGVSKEDRDQFMQEAMSGDYDNLLQTCMRWVNCQ